MKFMKNHENHAILKILIFPKNIMRVTWGIEGIRARTGTAPGSLLRRLRRSQDTASGAEVRGMGPGRVNLVVPNLKNHEIHENS